jgi:hypothetical protein
MNTKDTKDTEVHKEKTVKGFPLVPFVSLVSSALNER